MDEHPYEVEIVIRDQNGETRANRELTTRAASREEVLRRLDAEKSNAYGTRWRRIDADR